MTLFGALLLIGTVVATSSGAETLNHGLRGDPPVLDWRERLVCSRSAAAGPITVAIGTERSSKMPRRCVAARRRVVDHRAAHLTGVIGIGRGGSS
jgi:hypothetical protein